MNIKPIIALAVTCVVGGIAFKQFTQPTVSLSHVGTLSSSDTELQLAKFKEREDADQRLGQYAINAMYKAGAKDKLSDARKQILARAIVRVSNDIFEKEEERKAFITIIAIESAFQRFVQSPTGPKGLTQVAKKSFHEAMTDCGVTNINEDDVWETEINLYAGACYFRKQLEANSGDTYMAMIAYNQGPASDSLKTYAKNGTLENIEVLKYMAKFTFLKRTLTDGKVENVPALNELEKPTSKTETKPKAKAKK